MHYVARNMPAGVGFQYQLLDYEPLRVKGGDSGKEGIVGGEK
jgi:hypothetical protein